MLLPTVPAMAKGRVAKTTDDGPLLDKEDLDTLFCGTSSSSLHIHGLQEEDEGTYRCRAENRDLDTLFCGTSSSSLHIHGLQEEDEGTYRCRAENREDSLDAVAHIQVQVAPRFLRQPANALAYEKENVELECSVYGQPEPSLHWLKNGELLVETEYLQSVSGNNLQILGLVRQEYTGMCQCVAHSSPGTPSCVSLSQRTRPERECSSSSEGRDEYKTQISDLSPGSNYMVRVAAHTSGGLVGASIHEVLVFTKPDLDLPSASESESCLHLTHQSGGHLVAARTGQNAHHGIHHVLYAVFSSGWVSRRTRSKGHWYVT
ncbi:netrin receptor DCC-like isoform X1 [Eriocheir sinensis]|uniref:netrin receptor DCC-like isoform X1 n=2 Tax=Eriocheir sinensis TaxID=95602 RepID=UPI0021C66BAC|nr:netrin receptor DCC-like isoform X1 [Eriocheir sinensis]XP_050703604.1 netrin receptor DCC-like isoform X1 [Eriocheir sinensis]XP_050703605.1 netrin receptor DCC-like isoform X1 [Eriocheir sinensis]XP_050703606.1 netrin receptor DCC-like isoform X1 [Eriocheir sinensis]